MQHRSWTLAMSLVVAALLGAAAPATARPAASSGSPHRLLGLVPVRHGAGASRMPVGAGGNLLYHGGAVMRTNKTFAIYWVPAGWSMVPGYRSTINRYFSDVAHDSGGMQNVYGTQTQYGDTTGAIAYVQTFGGSTTTTATFPAGGCPRYGGVRACVTDAQVSAQVRAVAAAKGWAVGPTHAFFLFLPEGAGACQDASGTACAFTSFCAYHSWTGTGPSQVVYATMPYADTAPAACATGERPNGTDADDTLNVTSHEHREMIEDPSGAGWWDPSGNEGADKCAWTFGTALGRTTTGAYDQVIHGHDYFVQEEWTNVHATCVQRGT
jgi:hypothetical protein